MTGVWIDWIFTAFVDPQIPLRVQKKGLLGTQLAIGYAWLCTKLKTPLVIPQFQGVEGDLMLIKTTILCNVSSPLSSSFLLIGWQNRIAGVILTRYRIITNSNAEICHLRVENEHAAEEHCRVAGLDLTTAYQVAVQTVLQSGIPLSAIQTAEEGNICKQSWPSSAPLFCDMLFTQTERAKRLLPEHPKEEPTEDLSCLWPDLSQ